MLTFIKLGGSLITDKTRESSFRADVVERLAQEINNSLSQNPDLSLLIGHGSGSFGHFAAERYGTINGVNSQEQWNGFAEVSTVASELNYLVADLLKKANVPVLRIQPSASALCINGQLTEMSVRSIQTALEHRLVPLVHGDVAFDTVRGGTIISTEQVLDYLAEKLPVKRILLLGEVEGVFDEDGKLIPEITPTTLAQYQNSLRGSSGKDVTGGMIAKVRDMLQLIETQPNIQIRVMDGRVPGLLQTTLNGTNQPGTRITADH